MLWTETIASILLRLVQVAAVEALRAASCSLVPKPKSRPAAPPGQVLSLVMDTLQAALMTFARPPTFVAGYSYQESLEEARSSLYFARFEPITAHTVHVPRPAPSRARDNNVCRSKPASGRSV